MPKFLYLWNEENTSYLVMGAGRIQGIHRLHHIKHLDLQKLKLEVTENLIYVFCSIISQKWTMRPSKNHSLSNFFAPPFFACDVVIVSTGRTTYNVQVFISDYSLEEEKKPSNKGNPLQGIKVYISSARTNLDVWTSCRK